MRWTKLLRVGLFVVFTAVCLRCAWMSDDSYVTLRTVDNWVHGFGLRYNPTERVQAYTHPLWMLILAATYAITREGWLTPMLTGLAFTLVAAGLLVFRVARDPLSGCVVLAILVGSKAAVDFATSGLENPLENLLLVLVALELFGRGRLPVLVLLGALLGTTRLDALGLVAPAIGVAAWEASPRDRVRSVAGVTPLVVWHAFALVYYGVLLPNTAYAKLGTDIPSLELAQRSLWYFWWTQSVDPVTLPAVALGGILGWRDGDRRSLALVAGMAIHLAWVVRIGGDFMGSRFFVAPLWLALVIVARTPWRPRWAAIAMVATLVENLSDFAPLRAGTGYLKAAPDHGVVDERGFYWRGTGLWTGSTVGYGPIHEFAEDGRKARGTDVVVKSVIGLYGYEIGPGSQVVDQLGLADPLLARLPAAYEPFWRIGHFRRALPDGYLESLPDQPNQVVDPQIHALYDAIRLVTRAPLFAPGRLGAILDLQLGRIPVDRIAARYAEAKWTTADAPPVKVGEMGLGLVTTGLHGTAVFTLSPGTWTLLVERGDRRVVEREVQGAVARPIEVPVDDTDRILVFPTLHGSGSVVVRPGPQGAG